MIQSVFVESIIDEHYNTMKLLLQFIQIVYVLSYFGYVYNVIYHSQENEEKYKNKHKEKFWEVLVDIEESYSRKNYDTDLQEDPYDEHWTWWSGNYNDVQFQSVNCYICGEYKICNTVNVPKCVCDEYDSLDYFQEKNEETKPNRHIVPDYTSTFGNYPFVKTYSWISIGDTEYDNKYM